MKKSRSIISILLSLMIIMNSFIFLSCIKTNATTSTNWSWPTSIHTIKSDWPTYSSGSYHGGTDFPVALNSPVYSTCDGEVVAVTSLTTSYGNHIKIRAIVNGETVYMRYCHLNSFAVSAGDKVSSGQLIGYSGSTGNSTGPHLHYEVRNANDYYGNASSPNLNPRNYLPGTSYTFQTNGTSVDFPGEEDTSWNVPVWKTANAKLNTYDSYGNQESNRWIDQGDNCYIEKVYKNGYVWVKYPSGSSERWAYTKADGFSLDKKSSDIGTEFYAYIINTHAWKHLTNENLNVVMNSETGAANQVWYFQRQSDGSYKITNCLDGRALDVHNFGTTDGTNVAVCESNDSTAQRWFITGESGAYFFRAACGDLVLDINGGSTEDGTNVQMWTRNDSTAQKFQVWKLNKPGSTSVNCSPGTRYTPTSIYWSETSDTKCYDIKIWNGTYWVGDAYKIEWGVEDTGCMINLPPGYYEAYVDSRNNYSSTMSSNVIKFTVTDDDKPVDIGDDFYASLLLYEPWLNVSNADGEVKLENSEYTLNKRVWNFQKQSDGSYIIISCYDGRALEVANSSDNNGIDVTISEKTGSDAQKWFIYGRWSGEYYLRPKCSTRVLDVKNGDNCVGADLQMYELNYTDAQKFAIYKTDKPEPIVTSVVLQKEPDKTTYYVDDTLDTTGLELLVTYNDGAFKVVTSGFETSIFNSSVTGEQEVTVTYKSYTVKFTVSVTKKIISGDVNSDDVVNMKDIVLLQQYLNNWDVDINTDASDVNNDDVINMKDIVLLQQYMNGWDVDLR